MLGLWLPRLLRMGMRAREVLLNEQADRAGATVDALRGRVPEALKVLGPERDDDRVAVHGDAHLGGAGAEDDFPPATRQLQSGRGTLTMPKGVELTRGDPQPQAVTGPTHLHTPIVGPFSGRGEERGCRVARVDVTRWASGHL